jgi:signal transduction histidine kinase
MDMTRRSSLVVGLLASVWVLVAVWQVEEHVRVIHAGKADLRNRSEVMANTLGSVLRGLQLRRGGGGGVFRDRLQPVLDDLVNGRTNDLVKSGQIIYVALLNAAGDPVTSAGDPIDLGQKDILQKGERWGRHTLTVVYPIEGASMLEEGVTNQLAPVLLQPPTNFMRDGPPPWPRREPRPEGAHGSNTSNAASTNSILATGREPRQGLGDSKPRRPFWARGLSEPEYQALIQQRELHGLVMVTSTDAFHAVSVQDLWLRGVIVFFATVAALGAGMAWRTISKSSELQIRLVRASELNTHLKQMNLAAAGLAHETRNPLNIIRGLAHMISKQSETAPEVKAKSREIIEEADKVAAQLNEFINYSRPREVRRSSLALSSVVSEVVRALSYDVEEKKIQLQIQGEQLSVEADEQLLRQALFNLLLNAIQAVDGAGQIQVVAEKRTPTEAMVEVRDNGPGVPADRRSEIFKPYFTTQKQGTGLGLAVVQQIVLAHGWEIECLPNEPKGAIFRITHLKLAPSSNGNKSLSLLGLFSL